MWLQKTEPAHRRTEFLFLLRREQTTAWGGAQLGESLPKGLHGDAGPVLSRRNLAWVPALGSFVWALRRPASPPGAAGIRPRALSRCLSPDALGTSPRGQGGCSACTLLSTQESSPHLPSGLQRVGKDEREEVEARGRMCRAFLRNFCRVSLRPGRGDTGHLGPFTNKCDRTQALAFLGGARPGTLLSGDFYRTELTTAVGGWGGFSLRPLGCHLHSMGFCLPVPLRTRGHTQSHRASVSWSRQCHGFKDNDRQTEGPGPVSRERGQRATQCRRANVEECRHVHRCCGRRPRSPGDVLVNQLHLCPLFSAQPSGESHHVCSRCDEMNAWSRV